MANHADLPSSEWHPAYPPGAGLASSGDVFVSDGAGAGSWTAFTTLLEAQKAYGELLSEDSLISLTQATDPSLNTTTDYINLTTATMWTASVAKSVTLDATNGTITVLKDGDYKLNFWINHSINGAANANVGFKFTVNGSFDSRELISTSDFAGDITSSTASGIVVNATAGDVIRLHVACTDSVDLTIQSAALNIERL